MYQFDVSDLELMTNVPGLKGDQNILISGGTGFVGRALIESLIFKQSDLRQTNQITIISRQNQAELKKIFSQEILNQIQWVHPRQLSSLQHQKFHLFFHLATDVSLFKADPDRAAGEMQQFEQDLIQVEKLKFEKIFLMSSGSVYAQSEMVSEDSELVSAESSPYGVFKKAQEKFWSDFCYHNQTELVIGRCFSIVGPGVNNSLAIYHFIQNAIQGKKIVLRDRKEQRSYIYVADLVQCILLLACGQSQNNIYNLGSDEVVNFLQLAQLIQKQIPDSGCTIEVNSDMQVQALSNRNFFPNIDLIKKEFGFSIKNSLEQSIIKTIQFYQKKSL